MYYLFGWSETNLYQGTVLWSNMENIYNLLTEYILEWNEKINVTAIKDPEEFKKKNIEDSLALVGRPEIENAQNILDMGTGGGFPGLPLAIAYPDKKFTLLDTVGKKLKVIDDVAQRLGISNITTVHTRAEDYVSRETFDLVVSRAVANMSTLSEYCLPFVKIGGYFVAYKTKDALEEIRAAENAIKVLGGDRYIIEENGDSSNEHIFVIVKKVSQTPSKYPRKAGTPSKQPL